MYYKDLWIRNLQDTQGRHNGFGSAFMWVPSLLSTSISECGCNHFSLAAQQLALARAKFICAIDHMHWAWLPQASVLRFKCSCLQAAV